MDYQTARALVGKSLGYGSTFNGSIAAYSALTPSEQVSLNKAVAKYIVDNSSQFTADLVGQATHIVGRDPTGRDIVDASFSFSDFGSEVLNNARDLNPFDPKNLYKTVLIVALIGLSAYAIHEYVKKKV